MYESELGGCLHVLVRHDIAFWGTIPRIIATPISDEKAAELLLNYGIEPLENTRVAQLMRARKVQEREQEVPPGNKADPTCAPV